MHDRCLADDHLDRCSNFVWLVKDLIQFLENQSLVLVFAPIDREIKIKKIRNQYVPRKRCKTLVCNTLYTI